MGLYPDFNARENDGLWSRNLKEARLEVECLGHLGKFHVDRIYGNEKKACGARCLTLMLSRKYPEPKIVSSTQWAGRLYEITPFSLTTAGLAQELHEEKWP